MFDVLSPDYNPNGFVAYFDGAPMDPQAQFIPVREARVSVLSHAVQYGNGGFEGERYNEKTGHVFKGLEHTIRLAKTAATLGMRFPAGLTVGALEDAKEKVLAMNGINDNGYVRVWFGRGAEKLGVPPSNDPVGVAVLAWRWATNTAEGIKVMIPDIRQPDPRTLFVEAKTSANYMVKSWLRQQASAAGFNDALTVHLNDNVAECTASNIFFVQKDNTVVTPIAKGRMLDGITRLTVLRDVLPAIGIEAKERDIDVREIPDMKAAFATGSAAGIVPIRSIHSQAFFGGTHEMDIDQVTRDLTTAYNLVLARYKRPESPIFKCPINDVAGLPIWRPEIN